MKNNLYYLILLCLVLFASQAQASNAFSASTVELTIDSAGKRMSGFIYQAQGAGPHPTVLLLHGYPGNEKNLDLAQALRKKGWNVVFFHYRGAWGSEGEFSFINAEQDVQAVLSYLMNENNARKLRIDPKRISTVGHSMGGHMAMAGILDNPAVICAVSLDGANLGANGGGFINDPNSKIDWVKYSDSLFMLNGWSGAKAKKEITENANRLDLVKRANSINGRPVLLIGADSWVIPHELHIAPLLSALKANKNNKAYYSLIDDDHSFNSSRLELMNEVYSFLNGHCQ